MPLYLSLICKFNLKMLVSVYTDSIDYCHVLKFNFRKIYENKFKIFIVADLRNSENQMLDT